MEVFRVVPPGMIVWVSTNSNYVEKGVTEWSTLGGEMDGRIPKGNRLRIRLCGKDCWRLPLATKGVMTEKPPNGPPELIDVPIGEDSDAETYPILDGGQTLT